MTLVQKVLTISSPMGFISTCLTQRARIESEAMLHILVKETGLEKQNLNNTDLNFSAVISYSSIQQSSPDNP